MLKKKKKKKPGGGASSSSEREQLYHGFWYGDPGSYKSTCAATLPPPLLVWFLDGLGKEAPYLRQFAGLARKKWRGEEGQRILSLMEDEAERCRIEFYHNVDPEVNCEAFPRFRERMKRFVRDQEYKQWKSAVIDSATGLISIARDFQQYSVNPGSEDDKNLKWSANVTSDADTIMRKGLPYLPINIVVLAHIMAEKVAIKMKGDAPATPLQRGMSEYQDTYVRSVALPGRLGRNIALMASQYPEFYRFYTDDDGKPKVQTRPSGEWVANTQIPAPDNCEPRFEAFYEVE